MALPVNSFLVFVLEPLELALAC